MKSTNLKNFITKVDQKTYNSNFLSFISVTLIECLEILGLNTPSFCYHQSLSIAGNCRMCMIETQNSLKPSVSCVINLNAHLNVHTHAQSPLIFKARESVLELLLINHPIDCAVCDQAGECDLQDHSLIHGVSNKRFYAYKRNTDDKMIGPALLTNMSRCIHCTRCIRFCAEIAGLKELGMFNRGVSSEIGMYTSQQIVSELSGNLVDICPVGWLEKLKKISIAIIIILLVYYKDIVFIILEELVQFYLNRNNWPRIVPIYGGLIGMLLCAYNDPYLKSLPDGDERYRQTLLYLTPYMVWIMAIDLSSVHHPILHQVLIKESIVLFFLIFIRIFFYKYFPETLWKIKNYFYKKLPYTFFIIFFIIKLFFDDLTLKRIIYFLFFLIYIFVHYYLYF
jgi:hypothetical protein